MIKINLLPFRVARSRENVRRQVSIFLLLLLLVGVGMVALHLNRGQHLENARAELVRVEGDITKYKKISEEIADIQKKLDEIRKKIAVIGQLQADRHEPVHLLAGLSDAVVKDRMWVEKLESLGPLVKITGVAMDEQTVSDFMTRLEKSGLFSRVGLGIVKERVMANDVDLRAFELSCQKKSAMVETVEPTEKTAPAKKAAAS